MAGPSPAGGRVGPTIASLPDAVLVQVFSLVPMRDRLRHLSLVCGHWRALCKVPSLMQSVHLESRHSMRSLRSLELWVRRHAANVQNLSCTASFQDPWDATEALDLFSDMVMACSRQAALRSLVLRMHTKAHLVQRFRIGYCLARATALQTLDVCCPELEVEVNLGALTALHTLCLQATVVRFRPHVQLPPSITRLTLHGAGANGLPAQITALTGLQALELESVPAESAASVRDLAQWAGSLCSLSLSKCARLPASLSSLTQLSCLKLHLSGSGSDVALVGPALSHLPQLSTLWLQLEGQLGPLAELAKLTQLRKLFLCCGDHRKPFLDSPFSYIEDGLRLPRGEWLAGLTHLAAPVSVLVGSLPALSAATGLQRISLLRLASLVTGVPYARWSVFVAWLVQHPPLRQVDYVVNKTTAWMMCGEVTDSAMQLRRRRPELLVEPAAVLTHGAF